MVVLLRSWLFGGHDKFLLVYMQNLTLNNNKKQSLKEIVVFVLIWLMELLNPGFSLSGSVFFFFKFQ